MTHMTDTEETLPIALGTIDCGTLCAEVVQYEHYRYRLRITSAEFGQIDTKIMGSYEVGTLIMSLLTRAPIYMNLLIDTPKEPVEDALSSEDPDTNPKAFEES